MSVERTPGLEANMFTLNFTRNVPEIYFAVTIEDHILGGLILTDLHCLRIDFSHWIREIGLFGSGQATKLILRIHPAWAGIR